MNPPCVGLGCPQVKFCIYLPTREISKSMAMSRQDKIILSDHHTWMKDFTIFRVQWKRIDGILMLEAPAPYPVKIVDFGPLQLRFRLLLHSPAQTYRIADSVRFPVNVNYACMWVSSLVPTPVSERAKSGHWLGRHKRSASEPAGDDLADVTP